MAKQLAGYIRVSRVGDREERLRSPALQRQAIERFARSEGVTVEWFAPELDVSGAKATRPVLNEILGQIQSGRLGGLIVAKLDRLSRMRPRERVELFETVEDAGGVILSATEQLDPSTPEGRFARDVFLGIARMQWERYRDGFERAKESAIADGIPIQTRPAVGYRRAGRRLVIDERAAPVVREVFEQRAAGAGPTELARLLEARRIRTSQGSRTWSKQSVYGMLRNRVYLGELSYGRDGRYVNEEAHEAIVDLATWQAAQHPNGRRLTQRNPESSYLVAGIARCAGCRYCLQGTVTSRGKRIYRCTKRHAGGVCSEPASITAETLEDAAVAAFWALTEDLEAEAHRDDGGEVAGLELDLERAERALTQWASPEVQEAIGDLAEYATGLRERRQARDAAAENVGRARARSATRASILPMDTLRGAWERMKTGERRELLSLRFACIALRRDRSIVVYPAGVEVGMLPTRGFKRSPILTPFPDPPRGARVLALKEAL